MQITPQNLSDFRLAKITYEHTLKEYELFERNVDDDDLSTILKAHRFTSTRIRKRNHLMDWIWAPEKDIQSLLETLERHSVRHKFTDHTSTYYNSPEKLSALRTEVDALLSEILTADFVLDRIGIVGIENITKLERKHLEKESKK